MIVQQTASGPIELRFVENELRMEFNCRCEDALPVCRAMCCRLRQYYNVGLDDDELGRYQQHPTLPVLAVNTDEDCCTYLDADRCTIHAEKPRACRRWHCSPGGQGEGVTERGKGWVLYPAK